jgi:hypothetical protein
MRNQAKLLAWTCAILGVVGIAFMLVYEERYLLPGAVLLGTASIAFAVLSRSGD